MSDEAKNKKLNPVFVEMVGLACEFTRAFDRAAAHSEEHDEVDEAKDRAARQAAIELTTAVLSHAITHHPGAIETAYRMVRATKDRR